MATSSTARPEGFGSTVPWHPLLFAAYPVLRLYQENMTEIDPPDVIEPLVVVLGATMAGLVLLTVLLRDPRRAAIVASAVVVPVLLFGILLEVAAPIVGDQRIVLLAACAALIALAAVTAVRAGPRLGPITLALNLVSIVLLLVTIVPAAQGFAAYVGTDATTAPSEVDAARPGDGSERDIYHLILDRYGSQQALETGFGIDDSEFLAWLRSEGFQVLDDARANYAKTTLSLGATLGMAPLDDLAAAMGPESQNLGPVVDRIRRSAAGAFLQQHGYTYIHIGSWFGQTRDSEIADRSYDPEESVTLASTLYDLSVLPVLVDEPGPAEEFRRIHAGAAEFQFGVLRSIIREPGPTYVFAHILLPHPPYVFLEDGTYAPDRATFETQLADTNRRLRDIIEPLLARPAAERPIIILQADEGPFPERLEADERGFDWATATDDELVTKFGILSAMYLPGPEGVAPLPQDMTALDTYPELFRRYFDDERPLLPERIYASSRVTPYDLLDVTERVRAAAARADGPATSPAATPDGRASAVPASVR